MSQKVVLVTGGSGLVGKGVETALQREVPNGNEKFYFVSSKDADLTDYDETEELFKKYKPTHIIHLAAMVGGVFKHLKYSLDFFRVNVKINENVLSLSHKYKVQKVISCLSTCVFPDKITYPIDESKLMDGPPHTSNFGYSYAKRLILVMNRAYREKYGSNYVTVCPTNVFGPHDNFSFEDGHVFSGLIRRAYEAKENNIPFVVYGSGKPLRQFIYSVDIGRLMLWILRNYNEERPVILSVPEKDEISINEAAKTIANAIGFTGEIVNDTSKCDGQFKKTVSNARLMSLIPDFGFTPIKQATQETCDWYRANVDIARK